VWGKGESPVSKFSDGDPAYLQGQQYRTDANLRARMSVHERFGTNPLGWHRWVFDQLPVESGARVLELGAGNGALWRENIDRLPADWAVTITDVSAGVLESARRGLGTDGNFDYEEVDARALPFDADSFDIVIANHMLYHVRERADAIGDARAVLRAGGTLLASTNGADHLRELDALLLDVVPGADPDDTAEKFGLENGADQLVESFAHVELRRYDDALEIDDVEAVVDYLRSMPAGDHLEERALGRIRRRVSRAIETEGCFRVTKDAGLFVAS
jgi:SAM-dependent methyltransferase